MYLSAGKSNGFGTFATFYGPWDVAVDTNNNVYVADCAYGLIRLISSSGVVSTYAGSGTQGFSNGYGTYASFHCPNGIDVDLSNNVYVTDLSHGNKVSNVHGNRGTTTEADLRDGKPNDWSVQHGNI